MTAIEPHHDAAESEPRTRRGAVVYEINPFVGTAVKNTHVRQKKKLVNDKGDKLYVVNKDDGEVLSGPSGFWHTQEVDRTQFLKLYVNGVKAFADLQSSGAKMFEVLYLEMQKEVGKDRVYLSHASINQAITPMSQTTYGRGLKELQEKKFIAATTVQGWYFVNPDYVWNGDRLAFVKEYRLRPVARKLVTEGQN